MVRGCSHDNAPPGIGFCGKCLVHRLQIRRHVVVPHHGRMAQDPVHLIGLHLDCKDWWLGALRLRLRLRTHLRIRVEADYGANLVECRVLLRQVLCQLNHVGEAHIQLLVHGAHQVSKAILLRNAHVVHLFDSQGKLDDVLHAHAWHDICPMHKTVRNRVDPGGHVAGRHDGRSAEGPATHRVRGLTAVEDARLLLEKLNHGEDGHAGTQAVPSETNPPVHLGQLRLNRFSNSSCGHQHSSVGAATAESHPTGIEAAEPIEHVRDVARAADAHNNLIVQLGVGADIVARKVNLRGTFNVNDVLGTEPWDRLADLVLIRKVRRVGMESVAGSFLQHRSVVVRCGRTLVHRILVPVLL
mmetsp:Transcript_65547/g.173636  ORF Transcript_65547/g.173636 Transcript_65547/m.173636 type:complete len:356 (+) Transcript_65547:133-1200(+)